MAYRERRVFTYVYLWSSSSYALERAEAEERGRFYSALEANMFAALAVEAYLNHVGQARMKCWNLVERKLGPRDKLSYIVEQLGLETPDSGRRPFQSFGELFRFRDTMAHGKTALVDTTNSEVGDDGWPLTAWEGQCNIVQAKRWHEDVEKMITWLHEAAKMPEDPFETAAVGANFSLADVGM